MELPVLRLILFLAAAQAAPVAGHCVPSGPNPASIQMCLADESAKLADQSPKGSAQRRRHFEAAAEHYRLAADVATSETKLKALAALVQIYDEQHLNDPAQADSVLRELIVLVPTDPGYAFDLATLQEKQGFPDAAEETLLAARQRHPVNVETYKKLAQFYARRTTAMLTSAREQKPTEPPNPSEPDDQGIYRVGAQLAPPPRAGVAVYPEDAKAAGIRGAVQTEIVIDSSGGVVDAQVMRSVPMLDEAALKAVRQWRFEPTLVNGRAVPVRMVVTVTFSE
ncbi:MAG: TonB family protein [Vicinamibacterales bacterium]|nr:TonB family protein [Vicinamibacterales bacterium]